MKENVIDPKSDYNNKATGYTCIFVYRTMSLVNVIIL